MPLRCKQLTCVVVFLIALACTQGCFLIGYKEQNGDESRRDASGTEGNNTDNDQSPRDASVSPCKKGEVHCEGSKFSACNEAGVLVSKECAELSAPCTEGYCTDAGCRTRALPDGSGCNDGRFCTKTDFCIFGKCIGAGDACPDSTCAAQTCDETKRACVVDKTFDGASCGSGLSCEAGSCVSAATCSSSTCTPACEGANSCSLSCAGSTSCMSTCDCGSSCRAPKTCTIDCHNIENCSAKCQDVWADCKLDCQGSQKCEGDCRGSSTGDGGDCFVNCRDARECRNTCSGSNSVCETDCSSVEKCTASCSSGATCKTLCPDKGNCLQTCAFGSTCEIDCRGAQTCSASCGITSDCTLRCDEGDVYGSPDCKFTNCDRVAKCTGGLYLCGLECPRLP